MKKTLHAMLPLLGLLVLGSCKKGDDIKEAQAFTFVNNTDKNMTVDIYNSLSRYYSGTKPTATVDVPAKSEMLSSIKLGRYYIGWQSKDSTMSNWGVEIDTTFGNITGSSIVTEYSDDNTTYTISQPGMREYYLGRGTKMEWTAVKGYNRNGVEIVPPTVKLIVNRNYSVNAIYKRAKYLLNTREFTEKITFKDAEGTSFYTTLTKGNTRAEDTITLKVPFSDTTYKLVKLAP